jgi:hypothetical protein
MNILEGLNRTISLCRDYVATELTNEEIAIAFQSMRVLCAADTLTLSCHSAQTSLVTLVSLLSRMGMQVGIAVPDAPILRPQPPIQGGGIRTALTSASGKLMPGTAIVEADARFSPDIVFSFGELSVNYGPALSWRMGATDWSGSIAPLSLGTKPQWSADWPIGGMISALLAANEAFKSVMRRFRLRHTADEIFFEPSQVLTWDFGTVPLPEKGIDLGQVDFISAGAITQAALYVMSRLPQIQMKSRIFDDDSTAVSNLNRNMLSTIDDISKRKVDVVASQCAARFKVEPVALRYMPSTSADVRLESRVVVGVDDIPSRWAVQREAPGWVGVAGTSHFSISSSSHSIGEPCSGCLHPVDDPDGLNPIPTISFISFWAGLCTTVRLIRDALGNPYPQNRQHLWVTPLRLDQPHAAIWSQIPALNTCPVQCLASQKTTS